MAKRIIISGGGTGGHIFPAISIANALMEIDNGTVIKFVGAEGRMEMEKVPAAGYNITGLPVAGFRRSLSIKNISVVTKLIRSLRKAKRILRNFKPDVVVGVGGYASGPVLRVARSMGIPTLIQEQNSYAGLTNKLLAGKAKSICVAYEGMEKYFPKQKIILTGNPVRKDISGIEAKRDEAFSFFGLRKNVPVLLIIGGSLGSRTINETVQQQINTIGSDELQLIWQTGKFYYDEMNKALEVSGIKHIHAMPFISRMDLAFAAADIIVSRAGAGTISELCLVGKPVILIPSPNVAEDHQTLNAMALVSREAAVLVKDADARVKLMGAVRELSSDKDKMARLSENISALAINDSDTRIANEIIRIAR